MRSLLFMDVKKMIETPMHQLGHGGVGTMINDFIQPVMTQHKLWTKFKDFVNPILTDIASFRLDWCKVKTLPKKNWLGEDCFGFARLMLYLVTLFLESHSLPEACNTTTEEHVVAFVEVVHSFTAMIYSVMCKDMVHKKKHEIIIILFLTCCHRFCNEYYDSSVIEFWSNKQNYISFLNLSDQIEKFGALSLNWDGSWEASLKFWKKYLLSARKNPNSLAPRMVLLHKGHQIERLNESVKLHKQRCLATGEKDLEIPTYPYLSQEHSMNVIESVFRNHFEEESDDDSDGGSCYEDETPIENENEKRYYGVRIYQTKNEIMQRFQNGKFISGFILKSKQGVVHVPFSLRRSVAECVSFNYNTSPDTTRDHLDGIQFTTLTLDTSDNRPYTYEKANTVKDCFFCLLAPSPSAFQKPVPQFDSKFAIITDVWKVLNKSGVIGSVDMFRYN